MCVKRFIVRQKKTKGQGNPLVVFPHLTTTGIQARLASRPKFWPRPWPWQFGIGLGK